MSDVLLSEQLGAMARVDQLRHQQQEVDEHLSLPQRRADVAARIREYYQNNGIQFSDAQIDQGVREFFASRFVFEAPALGPFARLWSKVLLKRSWAIRAVQFIAIAALMVQCARVIIEDSQHKKATSAVIATQAAVASHQAAATKVNAMQPLIGQLMELSGKVAQIDVAAAHLRALRVPRAEYLKVKADKPDDGHVGNRVIGRKPPGRMEMTYLSTRNTDPLETILEW